MSPFKLLKNIFALLAAAWVVLWLLAGYTIGGVMDSSPLIEGLGASDDAAAGMKR